MKKLFISTFILIMSLYSPSIFAGGGASSSSSSSSGGSTPITPTVSYPPVHLEMFVNGVSAEGKPFHYFDFHEEVQVTWKTKNATQCFLNRSDKGSYNQKVGKNTSRTIKINSSTRNFYVYCYGKHGDNWAPGNFYSRSVTLFVNPIYSEIIQIKTSDVFIYPGGKTNISWDTRGAKSCKLNGNDVVRRGGIEVSPTATQYYKLECLSKTGHTTTKGIFITVKNNAHNSTIIPEFLTSADDHHVDYGESVTVSWKNSTEVKQCKSLWDNTVVPATGSKTFTPEPGFAWYAIECTYINWPYSQKQSVPITTTIID